LQLFVVVPFYLLVVTYAVVQLFLHVTEELLRRWGLSLFLLFLGLSPMVLLCLSHTQQGRFELLQLTAGYTHQRSIQASKTNKYENGEE
jgi:hypothetical protein